MLGQLAASGTMMCCVGYQAVMVSFYLTSS